MRKTQNNSDVVSERERGEGMLKENLQRKPSSDLDFVEDLFTVC